MSDIPKAMKLLRDAKKLINEALALMPRERNQPKAPRTAVKVTPQIKTQIKHLRHQFPQMAMREIGSVVGVDQGRVSEVLNGKR